MMKVNYVVNSDATTLCLTGLRRPVGFQKRPREPFLPMHERRDWPRTKVLWDFEDLCHCREACPEGQWWQNQHIRLRHSRRCGTRFLPEDYLLTCWMDCRGRLWYSQWEERSADRLLQRLSLRNDVIKLTKIACSARACLEVNLICCTEFRLAKSWRIDHHTLSIIYWICQCWVRRFLFAFS